MRVGQPGPVLQRAGLGLAAELNDEFDQQLAATPEGREALSKLW